MPRQFRAAAKLLTFLFPLIIAGSAFANDEPLPDFPQIELPPPIPALVGLPQRFPEGRARYLSLSPGRLSGWDFQPTSPTRLPMLRADIVRVWSAELARLA